MRIELNFYQKVKIYFFTFPFVVGEILFFVGIVTGLNDGPINLIIAGIGLFIIIRKLVRSLLFSKIYGAG